MKIEIKDIRKEDFGKAIQFAIKGMHFDWYMDNLILLNSYGRYFWYLEINRATQDFAAYVDNKFVGVLLAEMNGENKKHYNLFQKIYVKIVDVIQKVFFRGGAGFYEDTTKEQLKHYLEHNSPDGEIIFLAADPNCKIKGIGTTLLNALEEKEIIMELPKGNVPLKCFIYSKKIQ